MTLKPIKADIAACETDLFLAIQEGEDTVLAIGECKDAGGTIDREDAKKMGAVAERLSGIGFYCYVIFSKTAPFTAEEVETCRSVNGKGTIRVIMLSDRELEPDRVYDRASRAFDIRRSGSSRHDMALATTRSMPIDAMC